MPYDPFKKPEYQKPKPPLPTRRWLTPDEASDYLGVSRGKLSQLVRKELILPSRALGKRTPRFGVHELDELMGLVHPPPVEEEVVVKTPYLTEKQAAAYCRTSQKAMHDRAERREVRAMKAAEGEEYVFVTEHLDDFMKTRLTH